MNGRTFPPNPHRQGKSHHLAVTRSQTLAAGFAVRRVGQRGCELRLLGRKMLVWMSLVQHGVCKIRAHVLSDRSLDTTGCLNFMCLGRSSWYFHQLAPVVWVMKTWKVWERMPFNWARQCAHVQQKYFFFFKKENHRKWLCTKTMKKSRSDLFVCCGPLVKMEIACVWMIKQQSILCTHVPSFKDDPLLIHYRPDCPATCSSLFLYVHIANIGAQFTLVSFFMFFL